MGLHSRQMFVILNIQNLSLESAEGCERKRWQIRESKLRQQIDFLIKKNETLEDLVRLKVRRRFLQSS